MLFQVCMNIVRQAIYTYDVAVTRKWNSSRSYAVMLLCRERNHQQKPKAVDRCGSEGAGLQHGSAQTGVAVDQRQYGHIPSSNCSIYTP